MLQKSGMILSSYTCLLTLTVVWWPHGKMVDHHWRSHSLFSFSSIVYVIAHLNHKGRLLGPHVVFCFCDSSLLLMTPKTVCNNSTCNSLNDEFMKRYSSVGICHNGSRLVATTDLLPSETGRGWKAGGGRWSSGNQNEERWKSTVGFKHVQLRGAITEHMMSLSHCSSLFPPCYQTCTH